MGTIAAVAPISAGLSGELGISGAITMAAVVGGAMFGDNLSLFPIRPLRQSGRKTQMMDKFKTNFLIVLPAAILTVIILFLFRQATRAMRALHLTAGLRCFLMSPCWFCVNRF